MSYEPPSPVLSKIVWAGHYIIGGQRITLVEDEDGYIDVAGYVYATNPSDNSDGEFYLSATALRRINGLVRYERIVTPLQFNSHLFNVDEDAGQVLSNDNHYFTYTLYFNSSGILIIDIVVRDIDFNIVVSRTVTQE